MITKKRRLFGAGCIAAVLLTMGGCSDAAMSSDSLLRPPRATGDKAAIQDIIADEAGGSYVLKYPQKGENRAAITLRNENTDNEYALALYATENDTKLNASIIAYQPDKHLWECVGTYTNTGSGVDRVMFYDINGDQREEIIIGWTSYNSAQKSLTAYTFKSDEVYEMAIDEAYDELVISDITNDKRDDVILLSLSTQETPSTATLLQYSEQDKRPVGTCSLELASDVIAFSNILVGNVAVNTEPKHSASAGDRTDTAVSSEPSPNESLARWNEGRNLKVETSVIENSPESRAESTDVSEDASADPSTDVSEGTSAAPSTDVSEGTSAAPSTDVSKEASAGTDTSDTAHQPPQKEEPPEPLDDNIPKMKRGVIVDGKRSDGTFCTQMIYYDVEKEDLTDPINPASGRVPSGQYVNPTGRSEAIFSRDINGDDVIDIPVVSQMFASVDESGAAVCSQVAWSDYDAGEKKLVTVLYAVMNVKDGYYVCLPDRWNGKVTARSDAEMRSLSFYLWNSQTSSLGDKLLTIYRFTEQQWNEENQEDYIRLDIQVQKSKAVFAAQIFKTNADDSLNLSAEEVKNSVFAI